MDLNTKLIIKVQFNDEIRKMPIHNEDITYDELIIMMERVFKHKLNAEDEIIIKYRDEDNDLITISDDSDLAFAIETSNILKLSLTVENDNKDEDKLVRELRSDEIITIRKELQTIRDYTNRLLDKLAQATGDNSINAIASGRTSATGGKDFQEIGGKEFDPLSVPNHSQFQTVERTDTASSLISNSRNEDNLIKSTSDQARINNHEIQPDPNEIHRPSPVKNQVPNAYANTIQPPIHSSINNTMPVAPSNPSYSMGPQNVHGKNMPPSNIGQSLPNQNMPGAPNMGAQNMLPPNIGGGQNMLPNLGGQGMPPGMGTHNMPSHMAGQNMPPNMVNPNLGNPNMGNPNMGNPNMGNPNMGNPNLGNPNLGNPNMGNPNLGNPNLGNPNIGNLPPAVINKNMENTMHSLPNAPSVFTGNLNSPPVFTSSSTVPGQTLPPQRSYYQNAMQPPRPSSFQGPGSVQPRPPGQYFNPQGTSPQFNTNYGGYQQPTQK